MLEIGDDVVLVLEPDREANHERKVRNRGATDIREKHPREMKFSNYQATQSRIVEGVCVPNGDYDELLRRRSASRFGRK